MQVFVRGEAPETVAAFGEALDRLVKEQGEKQFKAFVISIGGDEKELTGIAEERKLDAVGWMMLSEDGRDAQKRDAAAEMKLNLGDGVKNTIFVYRGPKHTIKAKFVNLGADGVDQIEAAVKEMLGR